MTLDTVTIRSLLTKASDALWATPGTDRQIVRKASEPVTPWVRSNPGWPIRYHRSYPKTQDGAVAKREKRIPEYLEADEVNAIIKAAPSPKAKLPMLEQWRAGLRVSEAWTSKCGTCRWILPARRCVYVPARVASRGWCRYILSCRGAEQQ